MKQSLDANFLLITTPKNFNEMIQHNPQIDFSSLQMIIYDEAE